MSEDDFVIDSRLGFHFISHSLKIFIDADFDTRAKRVYEDKIRKELNVTLDNTKENMKTRQESEKKRYMKYYNIDPYNTEQYDLVIDSTSKRPEEVVEEIIEFLDKKE